jgi:hypothetical protein
LEPCDDYRPGPRPTEQELSDGDYVEPVLIGTLRDFSDRMGIDTAIRTRGQKLFSRAEFVVDVIGCVREIRVLENQNQDLTDAFVRGLATSRFRPARLNGQPVEVVRTRAVSRQSSR